MAANWTTQRRDGSARLQEILLPTYDHDTRGSNRKVAQVRIGPHLRAAMRRMDSLLRRRPRYTPDGRGEKKIALAISSKATARLTCLPYQYRNPKTGQCIARSFGCWDQAFNLRC